MKAIKLILYAVAGLVVLLVLAVAVFAMTFNPNRYKGQVESLVKEATGRTLKLRGDLEVAFWPSLGAKVAGVSLSERGSDRDFVALDSAHVSVAVLPLLHGAVVVDGIRLSGLKANVVKNKDGTFNFSDLLQAPAKEKPAERKAAPAKGEGGAPVAFDIAGIHIDRSAVSYRDLASGQELALSDVGLDTGRIAERAEGKLSLKAAAKGKNPDLDLKLEVRGDYKFDLPAHAFGVSKLEATLNGSLPQQAVAIALAAAQVEFAADKLSVPAFTANVALTGEGVPQKSLKLPITGSVRADLQKQTMNAELATKLDESTIQAKLGLARFTPPSYLFDVNIDRLNVDRYFPPEPASQVSQPGKSSAKPEAEDTPVDLSALKDLNASGRLEVGALQVRGLKLASVKAQVKAANGRLEVAPHSANLYEGSVAGAISAQADGRVTVKENLSGIAIGPLLRDFAQKDLLEGKGNVALDVAAAGKTVNGMKKSLGGTARVQLKNGAIKGINIAEVLRKAKSAFGSEEAAANAPKETDFSEMSASFVIRNGVAHNEDLDVKAPLFRIGGKGDIDIGNSTIDYVTKASVVASAKGQGGADLSDLAGVTVPVRLSGPFSDLKYKVDYSAVARDVAKTKIGEKLREKLGGKPAEGQPGGSNLEQKLKGLFGR